MLNRSLALSVTALFLAAQPLAAQDAATETPATEAATETPAAEAPAAPADLSMGATEGEAPTEPQLGQFYIRETFEDWALRCIKTEEENDPCQLYQLLLDAEGNAVAEISMFPVADGGQAKAGATIVVPLETLLTENLRLSVDGGSARIYPYSFCNQGGCVARVGFTEADVNAFKAGNMAKLTMVPAAVPDQKVALDVSLKGFTAGFDSSPAQ